MKKSKVNGSCGKRGCSVDRITLPHDGRIRNVSSGDLSTQHGVQEILPPIKLVPYQVEKEAA